MVSIYTLFPCSHLSDLALTLLLPTLLHWLMSFWQRVFDKLHLGLGISQSLIFCTLTNYRSPLIDLFQIQASLMRNKRCINLYVYQYVTSSWFNLCPCSSIILVSSPLWLIAYIGIASWPGNIIWDFWIIKTNTFPASLRVITLYSFLVFSLFLLSTFTFGRKLLL